MSLVDIVNGIETVINDTTQNFIVPAGLVFHFGAVHLEQNENGPRIIFVPVPSALEAGTHGGQTSPALPNQIGTRLQGIDCHCWGYVDGDDDSHTQSYEQAEQLADLVWNALEVVCPGSYEYVRDDPGQPDYLQRGWEITRTFVVRIPVVQPTPPSVEVETVAITSMELNEDLSE